jgi:hypothetical protein
MLPGMARRYADSEDVASVASVLLGDALETGLEGSLAAGSATKRAAARLHAHASDVLLSEVAIGDTFTDDTPGTHLSRPFIPAPDGIACWSDADTLASLCSLLTPAQVIVLGTAYAPEHADPRGRHGVSGTALASSLAGSPVKAGRATTQALDMVSDALTEARSHAGDVVAILDLDSLSRGNGRDWPRWEDVLTGTASPVVHTASIHGPARAGETLPRLSWACLPNGDVMTAENPAALAPLLTWVDALPALPSGNVRETTYADVLASTLPERHNGSRPQGVGVGMVHGQGRVAGDQTPKPKPAAPSKRKRDGGIGGPMTRA